MFSFSLKSLKSVVLIQHTMCDAVYKCSLKFIQFQSMLLIILVLATALDTCIGAKSKMRLSEASTYTQYV